MLRGEKVKKELPKVFENKIDKRINNNDEVSYDKKETKKTEKFKSTKENNDINKKIKEIFNSGKYIYKADVVITLKDKEVTKKIIGRNKNYLITYDNELIKISDILDIKYN